MVFVPAGPTATFINPSYHLPACYELWARWSDQDNDFWKAADPEKSQDFMPARWNLEIPTGKWRDDAGWLYFLAFLPVSGNYRSDPPVQP